MVNKVCKMFAAIGVVAMLGACSSGPSDELVELNTKKALEGITGNYIDFTVDVIDRDVVSSDVVKIQVKVDGVRNTKKPSLHELGMASFDSASPISHAVKMRSGDKQETEEVWITYVKNGEKWEPRM